ncbi:MAG: 3-deoxy-manno-octulosonate cytidylyltransferase [Flammeovirgaceae bacterium]|nr:3-deoxy-manno-octulosonate cytidylyltransferase [Flammeovirgaceae bacterium]MDW8286496.1 3-deoxy-manno-octulosonate cytidylyltransferase [Flammeovirgaceae bacterium]
MILGVIPARYASTRFPAKMLADIAGKAMIQRVYEQAQKATKLAKVVVATDHAAIAEKVISFGGEVVMTSVHHQSGTDRCAEAWKKQPVSFSHLINIQGDEPFIHPEQIDLLATILQENDVEIATLAMEIKDKSRLFDPNVVKVIRDAASNALYFSRHPIPFLRNLSQEKWLENFPYLQHIGLYGYRTDVLEKITQLSSSMLEKAESLEQLRWLENGFKIRVGITTYESFGIDVPEDIEKVLTNIRQKNML